MNPDMLKRIQELQDVYDINFVKLKDLPSNACKEIELPTSAQVLNDCINLQMRKSKDYQNPNSSVRQADHYVHGVWTIYDMVHQKMVRIKSLLETTEHFSRLPADSGEGFSPNYEGVEDSAMDAINFLSFLVSYLRGEMDGQDPSNFDIFNRRIVNK